MRGRSLIREPSTPSLCAFCAHRLGQARQPSHVSRRFLQSSRPVARPTGETSSTGRDGAARGPQPTWGRPVGAGGGPSWGLPAAGPSWGKGGGSSIPSVGAIPRPLNDPPRPADPTLRPESSSRQAPFPLAQRGAHPPQNAGSRGPILPGTSHGSQQLESSGRGSSVGTSAPPTESIGAGGRELDPHEQQARAMMLEREAKLQQRRVTQGLGPGPQSSRAGRYVPRTEAERIRVAQTEIIKRKAMELHRAAKTSPGDGTSGRVSAGPKIRHVLGDEEWTARPSTERDDAQWHQLKRQRETVRPPPDDEGSFRRVDFAQARAEREEQARFGRYTPLLPRQDTSQPQPQQARDGQDQLRGREPAFRSTKIENKKGRPGPARVPMVGGRVVFRSVSATIPERTVSEGNTPPAADRTEDKKVWEQTGEDEKGESTRPAKEGKRKGRGRHAAETAFEDEPKGKGRDRARRREQFITREEEEAELEEAAARAHAKAERQREKAEKRAAKRAAPTPILLPEFISVSNLAGALRVRYEDFVGKMEELGFEDTSHDFILNAENAGLIAQEYNFEPIIDRGESEDLRARDPPADPSTLPPRPPVITIMGHVDHGKTTLLDCLRQSSVAAGEHGGITQHIGAFSVPMPSGKTITFLDTPGHAAFLSMRQRGANITDIVILVVAADDSVKPQTIEAINHAKAANVPIIVAINKIDKEDADIDRVKQDLARHGVDIEDFGGETQVVCVSGKTGAGMPDLEEAAVTLSEILDMRADVDGPAEGWVIEASIKSMGKVATVLIRRGTVRLGDVVVAGKTWARIRCLRNEAGTEISEAGPGTPVEIDGWREQPLAGDEVLQASDEGRAKSVVAYRLEKEERDKLAEDMDAINESRKAVEERRELARAEALAAAEAKAADQDVPEKARDAKPSGPKPVYFIVKGDVSGSVEAIIDQISALGNKEVQPHILRCGVGQLSEFDVEHASGAKGHLINFNTPVEPNIAMMATRAQVRIIDHNVIYRLVDEVKAELSQHLPPLITQHVLGEADIAQIFEITVKGRQHKSIAGCKVRNGIISKTAKFRVMRGGEKVFDGTIASLKNVKKDVAEMKSGSECGIGFTDWFDFQVGDRVQAYEEKEEKRYL
ncbi:elongation factor Tu [Diplocarpon rosae]|nr:elongation factor Tu [Diplocarpon rosae]